MGSGSGLGLRGFVAGCLRPSESVISLDVLTVNTSGRILDTNTLDTPQISAIVRADLPSNSRIAFSTRARLSALVTRTPWRSFAREANRQAGGPATQLSPRSAPIRTRFVPAPIPWMTPDSRADVR